MHHPIPPFPPPFTRLNVIVNWDSLAEKSSCPLKLVPRGLKRQNEIFCSNLTTFIFKSIRISKWHEYRTGLYESDRLLPTHKNKLIQFCDFLDFSACFRGLSRDNLFQKFQIYSKKKRYKVHGVPLKLIQSYLGFSQRHADSIVPPFLFPLKETK